MKKIKFITVLIVLFVVQIVQSQIAIPTFNCMSLYWSPTGGGNDVSVQYRKVGDNIWKQGLSLKYKPMTSTVEDKGDYRGSVVNLQSGTNYEFKLTLNGTNNSTTIIKSTWSENFPVGSTTIVNSSTNQYDIIAGGTPTAYKVYDGQGSTINVNKQSNQVMIIAASYVIIRNLILRGGSRNGIYIQPGVHDVVIENCEITDWGRPHANPIITNNGADYDAGISFDYNSNITRVIIQRNKIHSPTYTTNHSDQFGTGVYTHPEGPQGITIYNAVGNNVIRFNEIYGDANHMLNDIIGGGENDSFTGCPGSDTDIYGNYLAYSWDNGLEMEGGGQNVRCFNNYMNVVADAIGNASVSIGPLYIFRNVIDKVQFTPTATGNFLKNGNAGNDSFQTGQIYVFNNNTLQTNNLGTGAGIGWGNRMDKHCTTRNNIIQTRTSQNIFAGDNYNNIDNDFNYDLFNGVNLSQNLTPSSEANGIRNTPIYISNPGFNLTTKIGNFQLTTASPGYDNGEVINNFTDGFFGAAPDMGAHENGAPNLVYGVNGTFTTLENSNFDFDNTVNIYPNPTKDMLIINISDDFSGMKYSIYNSLGQEIMNKKIVSQSELKIDISKISSGTYIIKLEKNNSSKTLQFIKN